MLSPDFHESIENGPVQLTSLFELPYSEPSALNVAAESTVPGLTAMYWLNMESGCVSVTVTCIGPVLSMLLTFL